MKSKGKRVVSASLCLIFLLSLFLSNFIHAYAYENRVPPNALTTVAIEDGSRYIGFNDSSLRTLNVPLTISETTTLSAPVVYIDGPDIVSKGQQFDVSLVIVNLKLENSPEQVYAADITVKYNDTLFDFIGAYKASDKTVLLEKEEEDDYVRIILADNTPITANEKLVNLTFKVKDSIETSDSGEIQIQDTLLGTSPSGLTIAAEGTAKTIIVNAEQIIPSIDITGDKSVKEEDEFEVSLVITGIDNVPENVYAADITVKYDKGLFEFMEANKASENIILFDIKVDDNNDSVRIVLSKNEPITPAEVLANLKFKAKRVDEPASGNITVEKALLGTAPTGLVICANGDTILIDIGTRPRKPGDVNGDGIITIADLAVAAYYYDTREGDPDWDTAKLADTNNDGVIDLKDLVFIAHEILQY